MWRAGITQTRHLRQAPSRSATIIAPRIKPLRLMARTPHRSQQARQDVEIVAIVVKARASRALEPLFLAIRLLRRSKQVRRDHRLIVVLLAVHTPSPAVNVDQMRQAEPNLRLHNPIKWVCNWPLLVA